MVSILFLIKYQINLQSSSCLGKKIDSLYSPTSPPNPVLQCHSFLCRRIVTLASPCSLNPFIVAHSFPPCCGTPQLPPASNSSPFLSISSQYTETHSMQKHWCTYTAGSQKHPLPSNTQPPHSLKN